MVDYDYEKNSKRLLFTILPILLILIGISVYFFFSDMSLEVRQSWGISPPPGKINILVLGVDERADDIGRSDTTFVVTIDAASRQVTVLSIPRDTRVKIAGHGWGKINHAYAFGQQKLSKDTVEKLLGIHINYTVVVNFPGFIHMVDYLGGVKVDVDRSMYYEDPYNDIGGLVIDLHPGLQHLNGEKAIQYVRYRDGDGDIGRITRQQKFLQAVFEELKKPETVANLPDIIKELAATVRTDMTSNFMLKLADVMKDAASIQLRMETVTGTPVYIQDASYLVPDIYRLREQVAQIQGLSINEQYSSETKRLANEYEQSVPRDLKTAEQPLQSQSSKTSKQEQGTSSKPHVYIVNASGQNSAGLKMSSILKEHGFVVAGINHSGVIRKNTAIVLHVQDSSMVNKLSGLPFKYLLQINNAQKDAHATVIIGQDFNTTKSRL